MIWFTDTVGLMEKYAKRSGKELEDTNFIIVSSRIRITKERKNVLMASNMFVNSGILKGVGINLDPNSIMAREAFKTFLLKNTKPMALLCACIECTLLEDSDILFLCSPKELKCEYFSIMADVVWELFRYPILPYPQEKSFDKKEVIKRLLYYKESLKKKEFLKMNKSDKLRAMHKLSKKKLKYHLKKMGLYSNSLTKEEMVEILFDEGVNHS